MVSLEEHERNTKPEAHLVGKDPYAREVDMFFFLKGDRFRAERTTNGIKEVVYGVTDMDGLAASLNFGWLHYEEEGTSEGARIAKRKREVYEGPGGYINVHFDHAEYPKSGSGINDSMYVKDGWTFYGLPEVAVRKIQRLAEHERIMGKAKWDKKLRDARNAVNAASQELEVVSAEYFRRYGHSSGF